ncbi:MAG: hypothetical protein M9939_08485 [Mesorhizobium sp.]|nr:hypothetical protein [Mesorhizobium sp.]MCO5161158.1 hypothetical protein [Mesorhizobium sp.]
MTISQPHAWSFIEAGTVVRSAGSLTDLAICAGPDRRRALLRRLQAMDPLSVPSDHPLMQLDACTRAAWQTVSESRFGLSGLQVYLLISVYEHGLRAGYDGLAQPRPPGPAEGFADAELDDVANSAWTHGNAVREWWRAYENLVSVLFDLPVQAERASTRRIGSDRPC